MTPVDHRADRFLKEKYPWIKEEDMPAFRETMQYSMLVLRLQVGDLVKATGIPEFLFWLMTWLPAVLLMIMRIVIFTVLGLIIGLLYLLLTDRLNLGGLG